MKPHRKVLTSLLAATALSLGFFGQSVHATPINVTAQLTGDIRINPDDIVIDVTITSDTTWNYALWTVDLNSVNHPSAKLDEFYFNMDGLATDYSFSNFSPADWIITTPATDVGGGGGISFMFESSDSDKNDGSNVTNAQNLTFKMTLTQSEALFTADLFLDAPEEFANDSGSGQLGAHVQSLCVEPGPNCTTESESGFAFGEYEGDGGGGTQETPEPGVLLLMGAGLLGLSMARRRKSA